MLRQKQGNGQLRMDADLDLVLDSLYGPLYYRFLVKNEPPSQKYAEALVALVVQGFRYARLERLSALGTTILVSLNLGLGLALVLLKVIVVH